MRRADHLAAHAACREALEIFAVLGHRRGIARALEGSACLALARGHAERALKLAAAAAHLRQSISAPLPQAEQFKLDQTLLPAWESLSEAEGKRAWAEGSAMSMEDAIQYSLRSRALLLQVSRVDHTAHRGNTIGWNACAAGVLPNAVLVGREVNAVDLVLRDITVKPLDLRPHFLQRLQ